jgi:hypothetical protein
MRIHGYDVLYQNTVPHLSCHELCVAHLVCLGLHYVLSLFVPYDEERRMINREIRSSCNTSGTLSLVSPLMHARSSIEPFHSKAA